MVRLTKWMSWLRWGSESCQWRFETWVMVSRLPQASSIHAGRNFADQWFESRTKSRFEPFGKWTSNWVPESFTRRR